MIVLSLAEAVAHAHQNDIVHRDIKPANVILDSRRAHDGLRYCPKLTDFGTAKFLGAAQSLTTQDTLIGTAPYMAPEQIRGDREVGPACDIYALGVLLYELITGQVPIQGTDKADTIHLVVTVEPPVLHKLLRGVPRDISAICSCCLEKQPERRYATAQDLASDLRRFLNNEPTKARPLNPGARLVRWSRRNPLPLSIMGAISLVFALSIGGLAWHTARLRELNDQLIQSNRQALEMKERAEESELWARRLRYDSDIRLAAKSWRDGDLKSAQDILARYEPGPDEGDLRGIEWRFLSRAVRPTSVAITEIGSPVYHIRLSPDQRVFATAGQDGVIRIHERVSGVVLQSIESKQGEVNSVAFSPNGRSLASAGDDGSVRIWRISDGQQLHAIPAHEGIAFGVEFVGDFGAVVSCGADGLVQFWKDGQREVAYQDHQSRVEAIAVSPYGRWFASVGKDRTLIVRELRGGAIHHRWDEGQGTLSSVAFSPDSRTVAVVEASGEIKCLRLFDLAAKTEILSRQHPDGIFSVAFSPDGENVLTTDNAGVVRIWDVSRHALELNGKDGPVDSWQAHRRRAYSGVFEPDGVSVLTTGEDGQVHRSRTRTAMSEIVLRKSDLAVMSRTACDDLRFHAITFHGPDAEIVVASHLGITSISYDSSHAAQFQRREDERTWANVAASPEANWFLAAGSSPMQATSEDRFVPAIVERWESRSGPPQTLYQTQTNCNINNLSCSPSGDLFALVINEHPIDRGSKQLLLVDSKSGEIRSQFPAAADTKSCFTSDGRHLIFGVQRNIHSIDLQIDEHRVVHDAHEESQNGLALSSDGEWLATSDHGRTIKIWRLATLEQHGVLQGHQGSISGLAFSSDSRTLLTSAFDGTVKAWNVMTGQHLMDVHQGENGLAEMALSADNRHLAVVDRNHVVIYVLGSDDYREGPHSEHGGAPRTPGL